MKDVCGLYNVPIFMAFCAVGLEVVKYQYTAPFYPIINYLFQFHLYVCIYTVCYGR